MLSSRSRGTSCCWLVAWFAFSPYFTLHGFCLELAFVARVLWYWLIVIGWLILVFACRLSGLPHNSGCGRGSDYATCTANQHRFVVIPWPHGGVIIRNYVGAFVRDLYTGKDWNRRYNRTGRKDAASRTVWGEQILALKGNDNPIILVWGKGRALGPNYWYFW
jgi:hypothetical protein